MSNQLTNETSPYLLQHAENPVNWYPWCEEAFSKAKKENKPIFLSIGYSTCHWCHVMAHESFEDDKTADILNKHFVSIKVDREERPDIDSVYMSVCQAFTGSGGWPMSIFMTWDKKPFFAGTYFPPHSQYGMPSFEDVLKAISEKWTSNYAELLNSAKKVIGHLKNTNSSETNTNNDNLTEIAAQIFSQNFDSIYGGFGSAPKFPTPHNLLFLMLYSKENNKPNILEMVEKTLTQMRKGGIFDHIGYGFSRYSTDKYYLVPHFEKMLYDNALLIIAYSVAYSMSNENIYLETAMQTAEYILNEMAHPEGGFYSAQDADSEGTEGKYYTFSLDEVVTVLGENKGADFAKTFDITQRGNFEGTNIPNLLRSNDLNANFEEEKQKLYNYRKNRFKLHLDDKILLSWNSMMVSALCILYRITGYNKYLDAAKSSYSFIENNLCDGLQLYTSFRSEKHSKQAFLDDYAFYITALIELYNSTLNKEYLEKAQILCNETINRFFDNKNNGFYLCEKESVELFINPKEVYDGAIPSGNSVMAYNFVRLYQITKKEDYKKFILKQLEYLSSQADKYPTGHSMFLIAKMIYENPPKHIIIALKNLSDLDDIKKGLPFFANISVVSNSSDYPVINDKTTYYICKNHICLPPTNTPDF